MSLGVYISTWNEEVLIEAALENLVKVFPQVEVIDLGSTDSTLEIVKRLGVPINKHVLSKKTSKYAFDGPAQQWIQLKNEYADKHDWILLLDGDEIFDEENLLRLKAKLGGPYTAYHIGWKTVRELPKGIQISSMRPSGTKLYKSSDYYFRRGWPGEILEIKNAEVSRTNKEPKDECDVWCWHGVLLKRSRQPEATARRKKRLERYKFYDTQLEWEDTDKWPWT